MAQTSSFTSFGIVLVTAPTQSEAEAIAQDLVQSNLAACVSITPIKSIYRWQGQLHQDQEWQLLIKADLTHFAALETKIRAIHSYDVPEIIALPIVQGAQLYLSWLAEQTQSPKTSGQA